MIGWHYTSQERYESIKVDGLIPAPVPKSLRPELLEPVMKDDWKAIWVFKNRQHGDPLLGMLIWVLSQHSSSRICLLEVEYDEDASASKLTPCEDDSQVVLKHDYTVDPAGRFGHTDEPIDLIIKPTKRFRLVESFTLEGVGDAELQRKSY